MEAGWGYREGNAKGSCHFSFTFLGCRNLKYNKTSLKITFQRGSGGGRGGGVARWGVWSDRWGKDGKPQTLCCLLNSTDSSTFLLSLPMLVIFSLSLISVADSNISLMNFKPSRQSGCVSQIAVGRYLKVPVA